MDHGCAEEEDEKEGPNVQKHKKSEKWRELDNDIKKSVKANKKAYYDKETEKIAALNTGKIPFGILKHVSDPDKPNTWTPSCMKPGVPDLEIAEEFAEYFVRITDEFEPIDVTESPKLTIRRSRRLFHTK